MNNTKFKKIFLPVIIISIIFVGLYVFAYNYLLKDFKIKVNYETEALVYTIKEKYPDVEEETIIKELQSSDKNTDSKVLEKYGYDDETIASKKMDEYTKKSFIIYIILAVFLIITVVIYLIIYNKKRDKKLDEITKYIKDINNKIYTLKIEENSEDELSKLSNELYKVTVLLKESAENSKKENENLTKALEDISHQLKTPLTSIRILLDNIEENPDMDADTRNDFIKSISNQFDLMSNLVVSILNLAKFDSGTIKMKDKEFRIIDLLNEVKQNLDILLEVKDIDIQILGDIDAKIVADYRWQMQAITNVVKNAIEHSRAGAKIFIKIEDSSVFLKLSIIDEGEGISKQDIKHIFERFYKSKNSAEGSIGIGLAFAKTIIEKDNGYITVESEEGKGTTFVIKYLK